MPNGQAPTVDYDALAKQYGVLSSQSAQIDYDALAKKHGAISSTPIIDLQPAPSTATQPKDPLSPAERRSVSARSGNPLNLQGQVGTIGKFQASMYSLEDTLREDARKRVARGESLAEGYGEGYKNLGAGMVGALGDFAGLLGQPGTSAKNALLTVGAMVPYARTLLAPYFAYQGVHTALAGKQPNETEADYVQRILLGSGMAVGSVAGAGKLASPKDVMISGEGVKMVPKVAPDIQGIIDFAKRARTVESINKGAVGLMQGSIMPKVNLLRGALHGEVERTANTIIQADEADLSNVNQGTIHATPAIKNITDFTEKTGFIPEGAADKLATDLQNSAGMKFRDAKLLRSRIGNAEAAAYHRGDNLSGGYLAAMRKGLDESMQSRAEELGHAKTWQHYNNEAKSMFDLEKGIGGDLLDSTRGPDDIRRLTSGEERAMTLTKKLASGAVSNDLNQMRGWMQKYGIPVEDWDKSLAHAKTLADAHNSLTGGYAQGLYRMILSHPETALIPLGVYMALHGAGVYGFAPYLAASAIGGTGSGLKARMGAGRTLRELGANLPPSAFETMLEAQGPQNFTPSPDFASSFFGGPKAGSSPSAPSGRGSVAAPEVDTQIQQALMDQFGFTNAAAKSVTNAIKGKYSDLNEGLKMAMAEAVKRAKTGRARAK